MGANPAMLLMPEGRFSPLPMALNATANSELTTNYTTTSLGSLGVITVTATITTTVPNTIILACWDLWDQDGSGAPYIYSMTSPGLNFALRAKTSASSGSSSPYIDSDHELWWAACAVPGTYTVTAVCSINAAGYPTGYSKGGLLTLYAVSGVASAVNPWDVDPSHAMSPTQLNSSPYTISGLNTQSPNTFGFLWASNFTTYPEPTAVGTIGGVATTFALNIKTTMSHGTLWTSTQYQVLTNKLSAGSAVLNDSGSPDYNLVMCDFLAG